MQGVFLLSQETVHKYGFLNCCYNGYNFQGTCCGGFCYDKGDFEGKVSVQNDMETVILPCRYTLDNNLFTSYVTSSDHETFNFLLTKAKRGFVFVMFCFVYHVTVGFKMCEETKVLLPVLGISDCTLILQVQSYAAVPG